MHVQLNVCFKHLRNIQFFSKPAFHSLFHAPRWYGKRIEKSGAKKPHGSWGETGIENGASKKLIVCHLHVQTCRFTGWANGKQNSGLVNLVPESRLPFVQISSLYRKTAAKAWNWYQRWLWRNGTRISVWNTPSRKNGTTFSDVQLLPDSFHWNNPKLVWFWVGGGGGGVEVGANSKLGAYSNKYGIHPDFPEPFCKW